MYLNGVLLQAVAQNSRPKRALLEAKQKNIDGCGVLLVQMRKFPRVGRQRACFDDFVLLNGENFQFSGIFGEKDVIDNNLS